MNLRILSVTAGQAAQKKMNVQTIVMDDVTAGQAAQKIYGNHTRRVSERHCRTGSSENRQPTSSPSG